MKSKRPKRKTKREIKRIKRRLALKIILGLALVVGFFVAMNHSYFRIGGVEIQGQKSLIDTDIKERVGEYLDQDILGVIPRDNSLFVSTDNIADILRESFPRIKDISVELQRQDLLLVTLGEKSAHSLWCIDRDYESEFDEECYFADQTGVLYARAPYFSGSTYLKLFIPETESQEYIGYRYLSSVDFSRYFNFLDNLQSQKKIRIDSIYFRDFGDVDIFLARVSDVVFEGILPVMKYNRETEHEIILRNLDIVLGFDSFKKDFRLRPQDLESIDVRFDRRALYTFTPIDSDSE